jgi:probable phosphoglycerate mutase
MPLIYYVRHGQTDYNAARRIQGILDIPINATGRLQARRNGALLNELIGEKARFDFVASPLMRARQTMEIVRREMGLSPDGYRTDDRLKEIRFGAWGGSTMQDIAARDPGNYTRRQADPWNEAPPEGQCYRDFYAQVAGWLAEVTSDTILVAHGGTGRCLSGHILKLPPEEIVHLDRPQDRVLMIDGETLTWL